MVQFTYFQNYNIFFFNLNYIIFFSLISNPYSFLIHSRPLSLGLAHLSLSLSAAHARHLTIATLYTLAISLLPQPLSHNRGIAHAHDHTSA